MNFFIGFIVILIDQAVKLIVTLKIPSGTSIGKILKITNVNNTGMAYSIGKDNQIFIIIVNIIIISILMYFLIKNYKSIKNLLKISIILVISGGISNLIDRITRGHVVDYIDINKIFRYPIFNIADMCIVIGIFLIIVYILTNRSSNKNEGI